MPHQSLPMLSKSRFVAGLQCHKRLYLESYERELATPVTAEQQALFDTGVAVGELARLRYPGGVLIAEDFMHHEDAVARTREVMAGASAPAIFEAAFTEDDIRIRVDVLVRRDGGAWDLVEVKSSASAKAQHVDDVAIQLLVLERAGLRIDRCYLAHIDRDYVYAGGAHDPEQLFALADLTELARARLDAIPADIEAMRDALRPDAAPDIDIGSHCRQPYDCQFIEYCYQDEPEWPVSSLPRLGKKRVDALRADGIRSVLDLPAGEKLSAVQERVRRAIVTGERYVGDDLGRELDELTAPVHFIDFETVGPTLPVYPGTSPFETIPFQWSDHVVATDGGTEHAEFLAAGDGDPRDDFAGSLIDQLSGAGTIVVYSSYEDTQLKRLQETLPERAGELQAIRDLSWLDLLKVIRGGYYRREFGGSFSLKAVLPALVPDLGYEDLEIQGGATASLIFLETLRNDMPDDERERLRSALRDYCGRDTEAMVRLVEALRAEAAS